MEKLLQALVVAAALCLAAASVVYAASATLVTVDNDADVGYYSSLAIDSSGNAVIGYFDNTDNDLKLAICNDLACSAPTILTLTPVGPQGSYTSLALDGSNNPVIAYYRQSGVAPLESVRLIRCTVPDCSSYSNVIVAGNFAGSHLSMALTSAGRAVISYYDYSAGGDLMLAVCSNLDCSANTIATLDNGGNDAGLFTSLRLASGDIPVVAYHDFTAQAVLLLRCSDQTCTVTLPVSVIDSGSFAGFDGISLALGSGGVPVIAYHVSGELRVARCDNIACTGGPASIEVVDSGGVGEFLSMQLDGDKPVISYYDNVNDDLKLARCLDASCTSADIQVLDSLGNVGMDTSLQLGSVYVSYYDVGNSALKLAYLPDAVSSSAAAEPAALPQTGFARGRSTQLAAQDVAYAATDLRLSIPSQGVNARIVGVPLTDGDWDVSWLGGQVGYLEGTAWPTWLGNSVLTGHVWNADNTPGVFAGVRNLAYGERIEIRADGHTYVYEVRETRLVLPRSLSVLSRDDGFAWLTLVTCEGYNPFTQEYLFRRAVSAVLVDVK